MNRRTFVKTSSMIGLGSFCHPTMSWAQPFSTADDHFFVLLRLPGGWDVTLGPDPLIHTTETTQDDVFLEYQSSEILVKNHLKLGPAFLPLQKHMDDIHMIKGVEMRRDAGHISNLDIISSGFGDGQSALFPIELAMTTQNGPLGVLIQNQIPSGTRNPILTEIQALQNSGGDSELSDLLTGGDSDSFNNAKAGSLKAAQKLQAISTIMTDLEGQGLTRPEFTGVAAAFQSKAAFQACLQLGNFQLDTHADHVGRHFDLLKGIAEDISTLFDYFKKVEYGQGVSLFDKTTFVAVSEFARTPALNGSKGKDHNPHANAVLLAGRGVNGGSSSGESFVIPKIFSEGSLSEHISRAIDFKTGDIVKSTASKNDFVDLIFPEDITKTIGAIFGHPQGYYGQKNRGWVIPGVVKS